MARLLLMEGNTAEMRRKADKLGVRSSSQVYIDAIRPHFPDIGIDVVNAADEGEGLPAGAGLEDYDGLVIAGSGLHAYDQGFAVTNQIELVKAYGATGGPILGSCWGLQIAVIAAGGEVGLSPNGREVGVARKVLLNEDGRAHPFFRNKPAAFDAPAIHYDEITGLPGAARLLASNAHSEVQAAIVPVDRSEVWAVQYHPEFDMAQLAMLIRLYADPMVEQGFFADDAAREAHLSLIDRLVEDPADKAAAWRLGVDADMLDDRVRRAEIINWIEARVLT
ncbi:MAG: type 1 glutamine amidotransferase [Pseudomonadota bacterium]